MIPGVPQIGATELLIFLALITVLFGAKRVPEVGKALGRSLREFRKGATEEPQEDKTRELDEKRQRSERESTWQEEEKTGVGRRSDEEEGRPVLRNGEGTIR